MYSHLIYIIIFCFLLLHSLEAKCMQYKYFKHHVYADHGFEFGNIEGRHTTMCTFDTSSQP